jgi:sensor histidine kinase regulating citrate/malate metabolism
MSTKRQSALAPDDLTPFETSEIGQGQQTTDQLDYLADMIAELRTMAHDGHLITLAGILSLAHAEAMQQVIARQRLAQN